MDNRSAEAQAPEAPQLRHVTLADLPMHARAVILALSGGRRSTQRLAALGFTPGAEVDMTHNYGRGPLIVTVRGGHVALGRGEARHILLERRSE